MKNKVYRISLTFLLLIIMPSVKSQILISILLGDKLNSGAIEFGITGGLTNSTIFHEKDNLFFKYNVGNELNRIDGGLTAGISYKFKYGWGMNLGTRYYYGLINIYKDSRYGTNSALYVFAEKPIGTGKQKEKMRKEIEDELKNM